MSLFSKLHPLKTGSRKSLRDHCNCIHASRNATGLLSLSCTILVDMAK